MSSTVRAAEAQTQAFAHGYRGRPGVFDELIDGEGAVKPHWQPLLRELGAIDPETLGLRTAQLNVRVREIGIAYDLFSDPDSTTQPWRIDLVPLMLPADEWRVLERAMVQRARLFERLLADLYGPRELLATGAVPHGLVLSDPSYLRPCHGLHPARGYLQFFACDVARGHDGRWRVIDTHTETPAGVGYALANRMVHTGVTGGMFGACGALRLAPFFQQVQAALARRANRADPAIGLLTPGPRSSDFFSHAYLARYLGLLLVEGGDLRVAAGGVSLKTLHGLMPLDLIVRCVAGGVADPLELDATGFAGPVGLLRVVREHPDLVANALGSALAENRGLGSFLPRLANTLLGEDLLIPDGPRWWLGDAANRQHVLANLDGMVIRPAHEGTGRPGKAIPGIDPLQLGAGEREALLQEIRIRGASLIAEEKVGFGTTPSLTPDGLTAKPYALRLFVTTNGNGEFTVMPGGLAMTVDPEVAVSLNAPDGESRDVWVIADTPAPPFTTLWRPPSVAGRIERAPQDLPSRAADNLFWLGRYTERADWLMRTLRVCLGRLQDSAAPRQELRASRIALELPLSKDGLTLVPDRRPTDARVIEQLAHTLMASMDYAYGLPRTLESIHRVAGLTRDRLSPEAWHVLNDFQVSGRWRAGNAPEAVADSLRLLDDGLRALGAFNGLTHENMMRDLGWSFFDMGRRLSRAHELAELLLALFGKTEAGDDDAGVMLFTLELADSFIAYRSRYRLAPALPLVLDLLLVDESNPRSIAFQLAALARHIDGLPQAGDGSGRIDEQRTALALLTDVRLADVTALAKVETDRQRQNLQKLLAQQLAALPRLSDLIGRRYFNLFEKDARWVRARSREQR